MFKYFAGVETLEELKKLYKKLAMKHHPDMGGSTEVMQEINAEYDRAFKLVQAGRKAKGEKFDEAERPESFREVLSKIINLVDVDIEICGSWIWVGGNTKANKETLKELKFTWAKKKEDYSLWFWRSEEEKGHSRSKGLKMEEIRGLHGSERVKSSSRYAIA